jgi:hypothetical protein
VDWSVPEFTNKASLVAEVILLSILIASISLSIVAVQASTASSPSPTPTASVYADFAVTASAGPGGTINPSGTQFAYPGSSFTFTITPDAGYKISNVTVDGVSQGPMSTYSFDNVQSGHEISASFTAVKPIIPEEIILLAVFAAAGGFSIAVMVKRNLQSKKIEPKP